MLLAKEKTRLKKLGRLSENEDSMRKGRLIIRALAFGFGLSLFATAFLFHQFQRDEKEQSAHLAAISKAHFEAKKSLMDSRLDAYLSFAHFFSLDLSAFRIAARTASPMTLSALQSKASRIMDVRPELIQFRVLSTDGKELFGLNRHDGKIERSNVADLKDQSQTSYFAHLTTLSTQENLISGLTLSEDAGRISLPHTPVFRLGRPILRSDEIIGYVLFNVDASMLLESFVEANDSTVAIKAGEAYHYYILNEKGGWLAGHKDLNFAWQDPRTAGETFSRYYPTTFSKLMSLEESKISSPEGSFHVDHFSRGDHFHLKLLQKTDPKWLAEQDKERFLSSLWIYVFSLASLVLFSFVALFLRARSGSKKKSPLLRGSDMQTDVEMGALVGQWSADLEKNQGECSDPIKEIFGLGDKQDFHMEESFALFHEQDQGLVRESYFALTNEMKAFDIRVRLHSAQRGKLWLRCTGQVQEVKNAKVIKCSGVIQDVSKEVEKEAELKRRQQKTFEAQKMAEIGDMARSLAHEINNPTLAIIEEARKGVEKFQSEAGEREQAITAFNSIEASGRRLLNIVSSLRKLARNGDQDETRPESASSMIHEAVTMCQARLKSLGIKSEVLSDDQHEVLCNPTQISQLLINLISYSIEALEDEKANTDRWLRVESAPKHNGIEFRVSHSGKEMSEELQSKIFESLFSTNEDTKRGEHSLALSRKMAQELRGDLYLDTLSGQPCLVLCIPHQKQPEGEPSASEQMAA